MSAFNKNLVKLDKIDATDIHEYYWTSDSAGM